MNSLAAIYLVSNPGNPDISAGACARRYPALAYAEHRHYKVGSHLGDLVLIAQKLMWFLGNDIYGVGFCQRQFLLHHPVRTGDNL